MTSREIELVQMTWKRLSSNADAVATAFYDHLFAANPQLRLMFKGNMAEQHRNLVHMITAAVQGLDNLEKMTPVVRELGRRHAGYGVQKQHYQDVGVALLWTLEHFLGNMFTAETKNAWASFYGLLAETMQAQAS